MYSNELEFSPFTQKGQNAIELLCETLKKFVSDDELNDIKKDLLDEEFFFKNFYVKPFTRICTYETEDDDEKFDYNQINSGLQENYHQFINYISANIYHLCWVYGCAGCGKTTYLHKLRYELKNVNIDICDFESVNRRVVFNNNKYAFNLGNNDLWNRHHCYKFSILLIEAILDKLQLFKCLSEQEMTFVKDIIKVYESKSNPNNEIEIVMSFFNLVKMLSDKQEQSALSNIQSFFSNIIDNNDFYTEDLCHPIMSLMHILSAVLACVGTLSDRRMIVAFDNIEYFVKVDYDGEGVRIPDKTVEVILKSVMRALDDGVDLYSNKQHSHKNQYEHVPCFLVSTRPATVTFSHNGQGPNQHSVDLTKWFWAKDIYENRTKYLNKYIKGNLKSLYELLTKILSDCTNSVWSLGIMLPRLFNYDYRRLCRVLVSALRVGMNFDNLEEFNKKYNRFVSFWDSKDRNSASMSNVKHLYRVYFLRMVLDVFNKDEINNYGETHFQSFFNKLMLETCNDTTNINIDEAWITKNIAKLTRADNNYSSYLRKVLTILHTYELNNYNNNDIHDDNVNIIRYISFETLLKEMFLKGGHSNVTLITDDKLNQLGNILYTMNKYTNNANWVPLTTIKWNCDAQNYSIRELVNVLTQAKHRIRDNELDNTDYGIRINPAGQVLLKILPEFEFFGLRYCHRYKSIFEEESMRKRGDVYGLELIINNILINSIKCVNQIIKMDQQEFSVYGSDAIDLSAIYSTKWIYKEHLDSKGQSHINRIFNSMINYLFAIKKMFDSQNEKIHPEITPEENAELSEVLKRKIELFNYARSIYYDKYKDYFIRK